MTNEQLTVRSAVPADLDGLIDLAARRREQYRGYQPQFWRPAADATARHRSFFTSLLNDEEVALLVAADDGGPVRGFLLARCVAAPPVYDPGGLTCMVDDFTVDDDEVWPEVGRLLLTAVRQWAAGRGGAQLVVVTAHLDSAKRALLADADLGLASEWWVGPVLDPG
jgi:GNAT superfamily N-acetyltransferase